LEGSVDPRNQRELGGSLRQAFVISWMAGPSSAMNGNRELALRRRRRCA
jgi:hypothetical protein